MIARSIVLGAALVAIGLAVMVLPEPAAAAEARSTNVAEIPCLCRFDGQSYDQGQCVCLPTSAGPRRACCGKVLNNSSWLFKSGNCRLADNAPKPGTLRPSGDNQLAGAAGVRQ